MLTLAERSCRRDAGISMWLLSHPSDSCWNLSSVKQVDNEKGGRNQGCFGKWPSAHLQGSYMMSFPRQHTLSYLSSRLHVCSLLLYPISPFPQFPPTPHPTLTRCLSEIGFRLGGDLNEQQHNSSGRSPFIICLFCWYLRKETWDWSASMVRSNSKDAHQSEEEAAQTSVFIARLAARGMRAWDERGAHSPANTISVT